MGRGAVALGLQSLKAQTSGLGGRGDEWQVLSPGDCSHWGERQWGSASAPRWEKGPSVKSQGERGSVGGIDEKGWSRGDAARRKEGKGEGREGRERRGSRLSFL